MPVFALTNDNTTLKPGDQRRFSFPRLIRLITVLLVFSFSARPALAAGDNAPQICTENSQYIKRQLGKNLQDNICQKYAGKVMLIVNTASRCAYTGQYDGLEKLYEKYKEKGLVVIGFPSNDFGQQEPGTEKSIKEFCRLTYGVKFPMYEKTIVKGNEADPLYKALAKAAGTSPNWNFHKYLLNRNGQLTGSYFSNTSPDNKALINAIEQAL